MKTIAKFENGSPLLACQNWVSGDSKREAMTGIYLTRLSGEVHAIASDGHGLLIARCPGATLENGPIILKMTKPSTKLKNGSVELLNLGGNEVLVKGEGVSDTAKIVDGDYPDIYPVIASALREYETVEPSPADFNPELLNKFIKSYKVYRGSRGVGSCLKIHQRGERAAVVSFTVDDLIGIIMPMRGINNPPPEWAKIELFNQ